MRVEQLELFNFCQHRHRDVQFGPGLTAVIGANGSGKSNLLGGLRFAITGENPNAGTKEENICQLAPETEASFVRLRFSHNNTQACITRHLRPSTKKSRLEIAGQPKAILGDRKVNRELTALLGIDQEVFNEVVVVAQDAIFGFLARLPAQRADMFQRLFHTEQAEVVWKALRAQLNTVSIPEVGADVDALRSGLERVDARITELTATGSALRSHEALTADRDDCILSQQRIAAQAQLARDHARQVKEHDELVGTLATTRAQRTTCEEDLQRLVAAREGNAEAAAAADALLRNLAHFEDVERQRARIRQQRAAATERLHALVAPTPPGTGDGVVPDGTAQRMQDLATAIDQDERFIASFKDGTATCPTCFSTVTGLEDKLQTAAARLQTSKAARSELTQYGEAVRVYQRQLLEHESAVRRLTDETAQWAQQEEALESLEVPSQSPEESRDVVSKQQEYERGVREYRTVVANHATTAARLNGQVQQLEQQMAETAAELAAIETSRLPNTDELDARLAQLDQLIAGRREFEQAWASTHMTQTELRHQLERASQVLREAEISRGWVAKVGAMRDLLHRDAAPRFVAQRNLQVLQVAINQYLADFRTDYQVAADEGLSFIGYFADQRAQPASRFSGGQKVVLALAFRLALNLMFAEHVGLLALDEPTAYLDETRIRGFEPVLGRLREFSAARGLQCIMVTHEKDLAPLFDAVVEL